MQSVEEKMKSGEKLSIKETEEVLDFVDATADALTDAASNGTLNWLDLPKLLGPAKKAGAAIKDVKQVWPELKDLDEEESAKIFDRMQVTILKWMSAIAALGELEVEEA